MKAWHVGFAVALTLSLFVMPTAGAQDGGNRLGPQGEGNETNPSNGTFGSTGNVQFADDVIVCFSDNVLYGFCEPTTRPKRLGNVFRAYITPINGTIDYRVLVDDTALLLGNGDKRAEAEGPVVEEFGLPNIRALRLQFEVIRGNDTEVLDYGTIRFRKIADVAKEGAGEGEAKFDVLTVFTGSEWTAWRVRASAVLLGSAILAAGAAYLRGKDKEENERPYVIGS